MQDASRLIAGQPILGRKDKAGKDAVATRAGAPGRFSALSERPEAPERAYGSRDRML